MPAKTKKEEAQNPLILRANRLMEAFAKSDDERDFYLNRHEGYMIYVDLDSSTEELDALDEELSGNADQYCLIPKLTFYETKKIMEGFVNEKVYDIDTKEKLLDIIQSKEARENFLEFIYDHHSELEKWQQYYQERSRIRIIEWLRQNEFIFVFEEDLDLTRNVIEKLKRHIFDKDVTKDVSNARKVLASKAKTYYSNEALNPRPKRGRPPKQAAKVEIEPQITLDHFQTVPSSVRPFVFNPDITSPSAVTFSAKFESKEDLMASLKSNAPSEHEKTLDNLNQRLASLRKLSRKIMGDDDLGRATQTIESEAKSLPEPLDLPETEEQEETAPKAPKARKRAAPARRKGIVSKPASAKTSEAKAKTKGGILPKKSSES